MMNRREFIGWVGIGWLASSLPVALAACNNQTNQDFEVVGSATDLYKQGFLDTKFSGGSVVVIQDSSNPNGVNAINPTCTHAGCTVAWKSNEKAFVCPCHSSKFAADGKVINGPAKEPLAAYEVKIESDQILVKAT